MMRRKDYQSILDQRLAGKTYGEIRKIFGVPKSTLSYWFKTLELSSKAKKILSKKTRDGILALGDFNKNRTEKILQENKDTRQKYTSLVSKITSRELMLIGAALYWAEGYKNFNHTRKMYPYVSFANSDPHLIRIFIEFVEKVLGVSRDQLSAIAMIYPSLNPAVSIRYWRKITGIPMERLRYYSTLSRASAQKRPKNLLPYGTLQIRVNQRINFFKIMGLIDGIVKATT